jgi:hypothetical protein
MLELWIQWAADDFGNNKCDAGAAGMVLDNNMPDQEEEESDADADLSKLLTPAKLPEVPTVSLPANQDMAGHSPEQASRDGGERSGAVPSTSQVDSRPQLPAELAEPPPGAVDPMVQVRACTATRRQLPCMEGVIKIMLEPCQPGQYASK